MDRRERYFNPAEVFLLAQDDLQSRIWTGLPCVVTAFPAASGISKMMLDCQPQIAARVLNSATGKFETIQLPPLVDVPIQWPGGGGVTLTFPIKPGDECWVVFGSRCIDSWWQQGPGTAEATGDIVPPPDQRMHSLSDGVAYVGIRSKPREFDVDATTAQLRSDDNAAIISLDPDAHDIEVSTTDGDVDVLAGDGNVNITTSQGEVNANGVTIDKDGNMNVPGNIVCSKTVTGQTQVVAGVGGTAVHLTTHNHPTAATGSPSPPTPGT
jgi:phage baseplate assembly protein gpV